MTGKGCCSGDHQAETVIPDLIRDPHSVCRAHVYRHLLQRLWIPALRCAAAGMTGKECCGRDNGKGVLRLE
jgi:hypothetical protein